LEGITKHLMTGPSGNSEFCFPSTSMFPEAKPLLLLLLLLLLPFCLKVAESPVNQS